MFPWNKLKVNADTKTRLYKDQRKKSFQHFDDKDETPRNLKFQLPLGKGPQEKGKLISGYLSISEKNKNKLGLSWAELSTGLAS